MACIKNFSNNTFFFRMAYIYVAHGRIHVVLHLTCLNVILNILPSCGNICISGFRCRPSVTTGTCYNYIVIGVYKNYHPKFGFTVMH